MFISSLLMAISLFLFAAVNTQASNVGLNTMEYFFQSMFNAILYGWTPEAFPTSMRGTASGIASLGKAVFDFLSADSGAFVGEEFEWTIVFSRGGGVSLLRGYFGVAE